MLQRQFLTRNVRPRTPRPSRLATWMTRDNGKALLRGAREVGTAIIFWFGFVLSALMVGTFLVMMLEVIYAFLMILTGHQ